MDDQESAARDEERPATTPIEPTSLEKPPPTPEQAPPPVSDQAPPPAPHGLEPYPQPPGQATPPPPQGRAFAPQPGPYPPGPGYAMPVTQTVSRPPVSTAVAVLAWVVAAITLLYMLPWAVAVTRNRSNMAAIGLINFLVGWSFIGWVVALVMACGSEPQQTVVVNNYGPPPPRPY